MKIAVVSDIHANACALEKVLEHAFDQQHCQRLFFLGDLLGYGAMPIETITSFIHYLKVSSIVGGNHEDLAVRLLSYFSDNGTPLFTSENIAKYKEIYPGIATRAIASGLSNLDEVMLHKEEPGVRWYLEMIKTCETSFSPRLPGVDRPIQLSHGTHKDRGICYLYGWQNPFMVNDFHIKPLLDKKKPSMITFVGHTHIPMVYAVKGDWKFRESVRIIYNEPVSLANDFYVINPGSVGFPRDGDCRASYAVLDTSLWTITFIRLDYDEMRAKNAMVRNQFDMNSIKLFMQSTYPNELTRGIEVGEIDPKYLQELKERQN